MNHGNLARTVRAWILRATTLVLALASFSLSQPPVEAIAAPTSDVELSALSPTDSYTLCFPYYRTDNDFTTMLQIFNPGSSATILMVYYNADGTTAGAPLQDNISAGRSKTYIGGHLPQGQYSVVIMSNQPLVGFASVTRMPNYTTLAYLQACSAGETTLLVGPVFIGDGSRAFEALSPTSRLNVQNLGTSTADVTLTYQGVPTGSSSTAFTVPTSASHVVDLSELDLPQSASSVGHVQLVSSEPIAAVVEDIESGQVLRIRDAKVSDSLTAPRFLNHADDGAGARSTFATVTSAITGTWTLTSTFLATNGNPVDSIAQDFVAPGGVLVTGSSGAPTVSAYQGSGHASFRLGHMTQFDDDVPHGGAIEFSAGSGTKLYIPSLRRTETEYPVFAIHNDAATKADVILHLYTLSSHEIVNLEVPGHGLYRQSALQLPGTGHPFWSMVESNQPVSVWIDVLTPIETEEAVMEPAQPFTTTFAGGAGQSVSVAAPAGAVTQTTTLSFEVESGPATGNLKLGNFFFSLTALQQGVPLASFDFSKPITVEIAYRDDDIAGLDEDELTIAFHDEASNSWSTEGITIVNRNTAQNRLTVTIMHLTLFGLSDGTRFLYLPTVHGK